MHADLRDPLVCGQVQRPSTRFLFELRLTLRRACLVSLVAVLHAAAAQADDVRYYEQDGVTYRETRRVVTRPVTETRYEQREQLVYREQIHSDTQERHRTYLTPVTEYQWQLALRNRWNPFASPYHAYELRPTTRWEARQEVVRTPSLRRELVPETRVVQVPVTTQRIAQEEIITRVVVNEPGASKPIGGVARLDKDPPRYGASEWRPAAGGGFPR